MITLISPFEFPLYQIDLCNPELGDNLSLETRVKWIKSMSGLSYGYKKTPAFKKHTLVFKDITRTKGLELLQFLRDASPYDTKYIDKDNNIWQGKITNYPVELVTTGTGETCKITLDFLGILKYSDLFFEDYTRVYNEDGVQMILEN